MGNHRGITGVRKSPVVQFFWTEIPTSCSTVKLHLKGTPSGTRRKFRFYSHFIETEEVEVLRSCTLVKVEVGLLRYYTLVKVEVL